MSENTDQSQCGTDTTDSIPTREQLNAELDYSISEMVYDRYHKRIFKFLMSLDSDDWATEEEVYEVINAEVSAGTKRKYLKQVFEYDPAHCEVVVDLNPSAKAFVDRAVEKEGIEIKPQSINRAKEACEELGGCLFDTYINYHVESFKRQTESLIEQPIDGDEISVELHEKFINRFGKLVAKELPSELKSFDQRACPRIGLANQLAYETSSQLSSRVSTSAK